MKFWGITGGIGSGKSFVMKLFQNEACPVLDADQVAREVVNPLTVLGQATLNQLKTKLNTQLNTYAPREAAAEAGSFFQEDGSLDRARLRTWLSQSPENQKALESILHPAIRNQIRVWMDETRKSYPQQGAAFIEASRLIESGLYKELAGVIFVSAPEETRLQRATQRDEASGRDKTSQEIRALMNLQLSDAEFRKYAQHEIINDSSADSLKTKIQNLLPKLSLWIVFLAGTTFTSSSSQAREAQEWFASGKARSFGMAMTAFVDDHNSLHVNPAGLALIQEKKLRFPDLMMLSVSNKFSDLVTQLREVSGDGSSTISEQLQSLDGTASGVDVSIMSAYWTKPRLGLAVNPLGFNASARVRTPSLLFAKVDLYAAAQGGITLGYAQPYYDNHLRVGVALKPFSYRMGIDAVLENQGIVEVSDNISDYSGGGWGVDMDLGVQGNLDPILLGETTGLELMAGVVLQNILENKYSFALTSGLKEGAPANDRRLNFGVAARLKNAGILEPIFTVELRDLLTENDEFLEYLHLAFELKIRPRDFYTMSVRVHLAKANVGAGIGFRWQIFEMELGTYAVNLGPGPGIGRDRRYYAQGSLEF